MLAQKKQENNFVWLIIVGIIVIINFPILIPIIIFWAIFYFSFLKKAEYFWKNWGKNLEKTLEKLFWANIPDKTKQEIEKVRQQIANSALIEKKEKDRELKQFEEKIFSQKEEKINSYNDFFDKKNEKTVQKSQEIYSGNHFDTERKRQKKKYTEVAKWKLPTKQDKKYSFPSIWDDYESVIDIIQKDKS